MNYLEAAQKHLMKLEDNFARNDLSPEKRVELEAFVSIAESLDALKTVLESWNKHYVPVAAVP